MNWIIKTVLCVTGFLILLISADELKFDMDSTAAGALTAEIMKNAGEADSWNKKGLEALDKNDYAGAAACFEEAVKILPNYSDAHNNLGVIKFRKGEISSAEEIWKKLINADPTYALASYNLALIALHDHQLDAALKLCEKAIKSDKQLIEAHVRIGAIYLELGQKEKGLDALHRAYKIAPSHPDAWSFYAYSLVQHGDTADAIAILKKQSDKVEAQKLLGRIEASRKNYAAASAYYTQAVGLGADPAILLELANAQVESNNCKAALQTIKTYLAKNIKPDADAYLLAGTAAKSCGDIAASQSYFEQGCKNYPNDGILRYNLGQIYFLQKKTDDAESTWRSLSDTLQDPSLLYMRAINFKRKGDFTNAEALIRKALDFDNKAEYRDLLGIILYRKGLNKAAEEEFRKAIKLNPDLRSAQLNLALCSKSGNEVAAATQLLEKQLVNCAQDTCNDLAVELSLLYYYQKMIDKAIAVLNAVKEGQRDERTYRSLAIYYREAQDWNRAIVALEIAVKKYVTEPQTEYELAETYLLAGNFPKAIERFSDLAHKWQQNPWRLYYQLGYAYMEQNNLSLAKENFEKSIKAKKDNVAARGLLAFVFNREGDVSKARDLWTKNLTDDPTNPALWINMGLSYERDGNYEQALSYYKKASDLKKDDPQIFINLGNVYTSMDQYTDALYSYKQALNSPKRESATYNIFLVYAKKRDKEQALKTMKELEQQFASSENTRRAQSEMALWNGDTAQAISILESLREKGPDDWVSLGRTYAAKGNKEKALSCLAKIPSDAEWKPDIAAIQTTIAFLSGNFSEVVRLVKEGRDTSSATQYNLALAYYNLKQFGDALAIAQRLVGSAKGSDRADICRLAGNAAFGLKQWDKAKEWYLQLSNVEARSAIVQYNLAVAFYNLNDVEKSWIYYQKARELDATLKNGDIEKRYAATNGSSPAAANLIAPLDSLYNAAVDQQSAGNDSLAEKLYLDVVAKDTLYNMAWNNLGAIYGKKGEIDKAVNAYQKAVERKHDIPETYANLINLYIALEEYSKARQWLIKGIGHNPESDVLKEMKAKIEAAEKKGKKG